MGANSNANSKKKSQKSKAFGSTETTSLESSCEPIVNDYAVVAVPTLHGGHKNFIGQVLKVDEHGVLISFLKKSYEKFIFPYSRDYSTVKKRRNCNNS